MLSRCKTRKRHPELISFRVVAFRKPAKEKMMRWNLVLMSTMSMCFVPDSASQNTDPLPQRSLSLACDDRAISGF